MACVNTNPIFALAGVWNVGYISRDVPDNVPLVQTLNVVGWIPVISIVTGVVSIFFGVSTLIMEDDLNEKLLGAVISVRGLLQICQLGILFAPVDIACSCIRSYRAWKQDQMDDHFSAVPRT